MTNCPNCGLVRGFHNSILQGCTCQWQMAAHEKSKIETVPAKGTLLQPLTDEEIKAVIRAGEYDSMEEFARAIERAHGIGGGE